MITIDTEEPRESSTCCCSLFGCCYSDCCNSEETAPYIAEKGLITCFIYISLERELNTSLIVIKTEIAVPVHPAAAIAAIVAILVGAAAGALSPAAVTPAGAAALRPAAVPSLPLQRPCPLLR